jgi:hypothetical protein
MEKELQANTLYQFVSFLFGGSFFFLKEKGSRKGD